MDYKEEFAILSNPDLFKNSSFNINDKKIISKKNRDKNRIYCLTKNKYLFYIFIIINLFLIFFYFHFPKYLVPIKSINVSYYEDTNDDYNIINLDNNLHIIKIPLRLELPKETYNITDGINISTFLTQKSIKKFNFFIDICLKGKLLDNQRYPLVQNPKITVTIPVYNGGHYLYYSLRSIQNQKMKDIEIIIIDDCSTDDSIEIIKRYMQEDERIRVIKNNKNRKILYSKSIAALNSRGKYIIQLMSF